MKVACMSPLLKIWAGRLYYKCTDCMAKAEGAQPAPGVVARLLVHAPPDTWGWRGSFPGKVWPATHTPAASPQRHHPANGWYNYTTDESDMIWMASSHLQGEPPRTCTTSAPSSASAAEASLHAMD